MALRSVKMHEIQLITQNIRIIKIGIDWNKQKTSVGKKLSLFLINYL